MQVYCQDSPNLLLKETWRFLKLNLCTWLNVMTWSSMCYDCITFPHTQLHFPTYSTFKIQSKNVLWRKKKSNWFTWFEERLDYLRNDQNGERYISVTWPPGFCLLLSWRWQKWNLQSLTFRSKRRPGAAAARWVVSVPTASRYFHKTGDTLIFIISLSSLPFYACLYAVSIVGVLYSQFILGVRSFFTVDVWTGLFWLTPWPPSPVVEFVKPTVGSCSTAPPPGPACPSRPRAAWSVRAGPSRRCVARWHKKNSLAPFLTLEF